jgi:peptidoglycan/xylan/chitin deacetylase (PgdA/CDA1 family)
MHVPSLLYHHIGVPQSGAREALSVTPAVFASHIEEMARRGYHGIAASDWWKARQRLGEIPRKAVLLTFDDGYADLARYAFPVLIRHGFRATVFVVTGELDGQDRWNDILGGERQGLLSADQIREWFQLGIEFGAHGRSHCDLTRLKDPALSSEIQGSHADLAAVLGTPPLSFAYPFGRHDETVLRAVARGFDVAFTVEEGLNPAGVNPLLLRRSRVDPGDSGFAIAMRLRSGRNRLLTARQFAARILRRSGGPRRP